MAPSIWHPGPAGGGHPGLSEGGGEMVPADISQRIHIQSIPLKTGIVVME